MPETRILQLPARSSAAIGEGGRLSRKILVQRGVIVLGLILLLGLTKHVVTSQEIGLNSLNALSGGRTVAVGLDIGGLPTDYDLQALADSYHVDGVMSLDGASLAEKVTAVSLHQKYLYLTVIPQRAPTWAELMTLLTFLRNYASRGHSVYLHDDVGGGRAVATANMLLLLRGEKWSTTSQRMTAAEKASLSPPQLKAIQQLESALRYPGHDSFPNNPYAAARVENW